MNYKRTHADPAMAFKGHCDYACALTKHIRPWYIRYLPGVLWATIVGLSILLFILQVVR